MTTATGFWITFAVLMVGLSLPSLTIQWIAIRRVRRKVLGLSVFDAYLKTLSFSLKNDLAEELPVEKKIRISSLFILFGFGALFVVFVTSK